MAKHRKAALPFVKPADNAGKVYQQQLAQAKLLYQQEQYAAAESLLAELRTLHPNDIAVLTHYGDTLVKLERWEAAQAVYQQLYDQGMRTPELLMALAQSLLRNPLKARVLQALAHLDEAEKKQPNNLTLLSLKCNALMLAGQPALAKQYLMRALQQDPENAALYQTVASLQTITADSPIFDILGRYLEDATLSASMRSQALAALGKAYLDLGEDARAFDLFEQANKLVHESLPPSNAATFDGNLAFIRNHYTASLFQQLSPFASSKVPQVIVAGLSRSGKSLVESLFRGVEGVELAGEGDLLAKFNDSLTASYGGNLATWLAEQTPESIAQASQRYIEQRGDDGKLRVTTIPGDLWYLGHIGLLAPKVPVIFCVRNVLDLAVTGYFQMYAKPEDNRYSYDQPSLGRQIAVTEKVMEHWTQVLPNPIYLVEYGELVTNPQQVMENLLGKLGLKRAQSYESVVGENAALLGDLGPIVSWDAPMPITNRFMGLGERFRDKFAPMMQGYKQAVAEFPRLDVPNVLPEPLPGHLYDGDTLDLQPSKTAKFEWVLDTPLNVLDNTSLLLRMGNADKLMGLNTFNFLSFDVTGDANPSPSELQNPRLQYVKDMLLGDGQPTVLYGCMSTDCTSTLKPLPAAQLTAQQADDLEVLAEFPVRTVALDQIDGMTHLDCLLLGPRNDSLAILENGKRVLADTLLIQVGVLFEQLYERQTSFAELSYWAAQNGFRMHQLAKPVFHSAIDTRAPELRPFAREPEGSVLEQANVLLLPNLERTAKLTDSQRLKLAFVLDGLYGLHDQAYALLQAIGGDLADNFFKARGYFDYRGDGPAMQELADFRAKLADGASHLALGVELQTLGQRFPLDAQSQRLFAEFCFWHGNLEQAIAPLQMATKLAPGDFSIRMTAVDVLLRGGLWWEAEIVQQAVQKRLPESLHVRKRGWQVLAAQPAPDKVQVQRALQQREEAPWSEDGREQALELSTQARLYAHAGQVDAALAGHTQALSSIAEKVGPLKAELLLAQAQTQLQVGQVDAACHSLWQACNTRPYSPYAVRAYQRFLQALPKAGDAALQVIVGLHQDIQKAWAGYSKDALQYSFGDYGLPYQSFEPLMLPGTRPAMHRLGIYNLEEFLPSKARALDIGCNHGFLLMGLADKLEYGYGFDISKSCIDVGRKVAAHLGHSHIDLNHLTFDQFKPTKAFDLVIACAVHHWIGMPLDAFGKKLHSFCKPGGIVLLESQGTRNTESTEVGFLEKANTIVSAGFKVLRTGSLCDDGLNYREFWVLRRVG